MSLPIKETPVLYGKDAKRFREKMIEAETRPATEKEKADYLRARDVYNKMKDSAIEKDFFKP